ncbi:MAG: hypothetical protein JWM91_979 [Rhodospirillales bacterium]|nr:hypothetical protein [Rhodospirillales bacterium]
MSSHSDAAIKSGDRVATARLESVAALRRGARISRFLDHQAKGLSGAWFAHQIAGFKLKVVEGAVTLSGPASGMSSVAASAHFLEVSRADIARLMIIKGNGEAEDGHSASAGRFWGGLLHTGTVTECQELLRLGTDPEHFLGRLGKHTRRNVRRAERIAGELEMQARFQLNPQPLSSDDAVHGLAARNKPVPLTAKRLTAYEMLIAGKASGFESRFTLRTGEVVSYMRGYIDNGVAYLVYQANDPIVPRINLSLLHRFLLIERLIAYGIGEIIFPFGCEGLLKSACETLHIEERLVIRASARGIFTAILVSLCLPKTRIANLVRSTLRATLSRFLERHVLAGPSQLSMEKRPSRRTSQDVAAGLADYEHSMPPAA